MNGHLNHKFNLNWRKNLKHEKIDKTQVKLHMLKKKLLIITKLNVLRRYFILMITLINKKKLLVKRLEKF
jgi:hypothetical protein